MSSTIPSPPAGMTARYNPATGIWEPYSSRMARGMLGEQTMGFYFGEHGYFIIEGPGGSAGHAANAPGFDGVAYNPRTKDLIVYDNKAWKRTRVESAGVFQKNLDRRLEELTKRVEALGRHGHLPHQKAIVAKLRQARRALQSGRALPKGFRLAITNAGGSMAGKELGRRLARLGVESIDVHAGPPRVGPPRASRPQVKVLRRKLSESAAEAQGRAMQSVARRTEAELAERAVSKGAPTAARRFLQKKLPKLGARHIARLMARKGAGRALSLGPLVGWGFAAEDAFHGLKDIFRGHVGRGLAGVGLSVADVAADALHLGDAVSGVGGTALSVGVQIGTSAGQMALEMERAEERMAELIQEVDRMQALPPDSRLRDYYEMDDETISEVRQAFAQPEGQLPSGDPAEGTGRLQVPPPAFRHVPLPAADPDPVPNPAGRPAGSGQPQAVPPAILAPPKRRIELEPRSRSWADEPCA